MNVTSPREMNATGLKTKNLWGWSRKRYLFIDYNSFSVFFVEISCLYNSTLEKIKVSLIVVMLKQPLITFFRFSDSEFNFFIFIYFSFSLLQYCGAAQEICFSVMNSRCILLPLSENWLSQWVVNMGGGRKRVHLKQDSTQEINKTHVCIKLE